MSFFFCSMSLQTFRSYNIPFIVCIGKKVYYRKREITTIRQESFIILSIYCYILRIKDSQLYVFVTQYCKIFSYKVIPNYKWAREPNLSWSENWYTQANCKRWIRLKFIIFILNFGYLLTTWAENRKKNWKIKA